MKIKKQIAGAAMSFLVFALCTFLSQLYKFNKIVLQIFSKCVFEQWKNIRFCVYSVCILAQFL